MSGSYINQISAAVASIVTTFDTIVSGTNITATLIVGSGASLTFSGSGVVNANQLYSIPISSVVPTAGQVLTIVPIGSPPVFMAEWQTPSGGSGSPGGTDTAVQFNNAGTFGGDATAFAWDDSTQSLTVTGGANSSEFLTTGTNSNNNLEVSGDGADNGVYINANEIGAGILIETATSFQVYAEEYIFLGSFHTPLGMGIQIDGGASVTDIVFVVGGPLTGVAVLEMGGTTATPELSFFGAALTPQPTITGSRNGNPGLASLLSALNTQGLIVDGTTAGSLSVSFDSITSGENTTAAMMVGPGATLTFVSGGSPATTGVVNANEIYGIPVSSAAPTEGQVLTIVSAGSPAILEAQWQTASSAAITTVTSMYATSLQDATILANGTFTVTLTTAGLPIGQIYRVKNIGTGVITVVGQTGNIDDAANFILSSQYDSAEFQWDGTDWWVF